VDNINSELKEQISKAFAKDQILKINSSKLTTYFLGTIYAPRENTFLFKKRDKLNYVNYSVNSDQYMLTRSDPNVSLNFGWIEFYQGAKQLENTAISFIFHISKSDFDTFNTFYPYNDLIE
jgi:hypothetical protein